MTITRTINGENVSIELTSDEVFQVHREFVTNWMSETLVNMGMPEESAKDWGNRAYDIYCDEEGLTEADAVELADDEAREEFTAEAVLKKALSLKENDFFKLNLGFDHSKGQYNFAVITRVKEGVKVEIVSAVNREDNISTLLFVESDSDKESAKTELKDVLCDSRFGRCELSEKPIDQILRFGDQN